RPRESAHVKLDGRIDVCQLFLPDAQRNGLAKFRIRIGRLPREARKRLGEMNDVLSRTAGYLQHNAPGGQNARENIEYRAFVALCRGEEPFPVSLLLATLPKHPCSMKANSLLKKPQNSVVASAIPALPSRIGDN